MLSKYSLLRRAHSYRLLVAIGIALVIVVLVYQPVKIQGDSMAPLLSDRELIFINRLVYHFEPAQRGDVIVFSYPLPMTGGFISSVSTSRFGRRYVEEEAGYCQKAARVIGKAAEH
jgi:signal peptidase I